MTISEALGKDKSIRLTNERKTHVPKGDGLSSVWERSVSSENPLSFSD